MRIFILLYTILFSSYCIFNCGSDSSDSISKPENNTDGVQIIADHTIVDRYDNIPQQYIDEVKKMWINIPGESHSVAYREGLTLLAAQDSGFPAVSTESGNPEAYTDQHLRTSWLLRYSTWWTQGCGESEWYTWYAYDAASQPAENDLIKNHIQYSNTNNMEIAAIGFGWCWDMTWTNDPGGTEDPVYFVHWAGSSEGGPDGNALWGLDAGDTALTGNRVSMDTYLSATEEYRLFCVNNGYSTKVLFTTGPVDGASGENGYQRHLKHEYMRTFVKANAARILFDYADILCYDDGSNTPNTTTWTDSQGTVHTYPVITAANLGDASIGHIGSAGAIRLAKAQWWLLARIAGWDGN